MQLPDNAKPARIPLHVFLRAVELNQAVVSNTPTAIETVLLK